MFAIENVAVADSYTDAVKLGPLYTGRLLAVQLFNNPATLELARLPVSGIRDAQVYGEVTIAPGSVVFPGAIQLRAKNAVAGQVARIFAQLYDRTDPEMVGYIPITQTVTASGSVVPPSVGASVTGIVPASGTTPTAGTGFTYTHTNGTGIYVFTFATAFAAAPLVTVTPNGIGGGNGIIAPVVTGLGASGFTVTLYDVNGTLDQAFSFAAQPVS